MKRYKEKYLPLIFGNGKIEVKHAAYVCPICLQQYILVTEKGIEESADFSLDHFPPQSVGGNLSVLVCKKCNNEAGSNYEAALLQKMQELSFTKRHAASVLQGNATITNVHGWYRTELQVQSGKNLMIDFSAREKAKFLKEWIDAGSENKDWEIKLTIPRVNQQELCRAFLKTAYLICFVNWGYEFVYSSTGERMRMVLNEKIEYPFPDGAVFYLDETNQSREELDKIPLGVYFIQGPKKFQSFAVNIPLEIPSGYSCISTVIIASPIDTDWKNLTSLHNLFSVNKGVNITFKKLDISLDNEVANGYTTQWKDNFVG